MKTRSKTVELVKEGHFDNDVIVAQIDRCVKKGIGNTLHKQGWNAVAPEIVQSGPNTIAKIRFYKKQKRERDNSDEVFSKQLDDILEKMALYTRSNSWAFRDSNIADKVTPKQNFDFALPADVIPWFGHIYDRNAQIRIIHSAIVAAKASNFEQRNHVLLFGEPGGGKTEVLLAFEKMVGSQNVVRLNAESTTRAGVENLLLELDVVPPLLFIEEIEKCNPLNLSFLLAILDQRGQIIKTNARIGSIRKEVKCLCIATANDMDLLKSVFSGAIASRFQHKVYFNKCGRNVLEKILHREVVKVNGNPQWINPILDYICDVEKNFDPRRACSLLDGRDKWLTGEYKNDLLAIMNLMKEDNVM